MKIKKAVRWAIVLVLTPIILFLLVAVALYLPPVQDWAVKRAAAYASEQMQMDISIEQLRLKFPIRFKAESILATKTIDGAQTDTIARLASATVNIRLLPLIGGNVVIDEFDMRNAAFFTSDLVDAARVKGRLAQLTLSSRGINLMESLANIDEVALKNGFVSVALPDSVPPDTTKSEPSIWQVAVGKVKIENVGVDFRMNSDTLVAGLDISQATTQDIRLRLADSYYRLGQTSINLSSLSYDNGPVATPVSRSSDSDLPVDFNHLRLNKVKLAADSLVYHDPNMVLALTQMAFKEQSGIEVASASGLLTMDSSSVKLPNLTLRTPTSMLNASLTADFAAFDSIPRGKFVATVSGSLSPDDILPMLTMAPKRFINSWPRVPMMVTAEAEGNMNAVYIKTIKASLPGAFSIAASGNVRNFSDIERLKADVKIDASTQNAAFLTQWLDPSTASQLRIPSGINATATAQADGSAYAIDMKASQGGGWLRANGRVDTKRESYRLVASTSNLHLKGFMPSLPVDRLTANIEASGRGFDPTSTRSSIDAKGDITGITYEKRRITGINFDAKLHDGKARVALNSTDSVARGSMTIDGLLSTRKLDATLAAELSKIDLYELGLIENPLSIGLCGYMDMSSDLDKSHRLQASVSDICIIDSVNTYHPRDVELSLLTNVDTTVVELQTGDFAMKAEMGGGYETLATSGTQLMDEMSRQISEKYIDYPLLREKLPVAHIDVTGGKDNMVSRLLAYYGIGVGQIDADIVSSPITGLNGMAEIKSIEASGVEIDYTKLNINSSDESINYNLQVKNFEEDNPYIFNALVDGSMAGNQTQLKTRIYDKADSLGLSIAMKAMMEEGGVGMMISELDPVIGYKTFRANADNKIFMASDQRVTANVKLLADDGTGVMLYSDNDNTDALQDLTLSLHQINLGQIMAAIPYAPNVEGMFSGDFHAIQTEENLSLSTDFNIDSLVYENNAMGDIGADLVYMPLTDGSHHVDGIFTNDGVEVASIDGNYNMNTSRLDAEMQLDKFPLRYANGFVPDQIVGLRGYGAGELTLKGHTDSLNVNGELLFDDAAIYSVPYGVDMTFDETPVEVKNSRILLKDFKLYAKDNSPLRLNGTLDFSDLAAMALNVTMQANNFKVIDAKENSRSETFGKAYVDFFATAKGPLEALTIKGLLNVLGSTDMTYILRDSPLTTDNQLDELVKFTDFADTTQVATVERPPIDGLSMDLTVNVDESARILCALNAAKTNYVDLVGSGNLRMQYTQGDIRLTGKYTLSNGEMKYSLPIIPLKTFTIQDGSSVEFTGDPFNPKLDITATEQVKSNVTSDDGTSRTVTFTTGVIISKTLSDMGLEFTIDAPEDLTLHNELQTMSLENRGKIAVTMLTTGMYLADGNTNSFTMNSALSAFLNSQINNISAGALRSLDMSFDMTGSVGSSGEEHTDYSFKFAKRFWNNRLRIVVGGKLSSGDDMENQNETFFDNVTFEYRLSDKANKYLNLFYKRDSYDWLEGYVTEFGAGFLWKRKMQRIGDLFPFRKKAGRMPTMPQNVVEPTDSASKPIVIRPQ